MMIRYDSRSGQYYCEDKSLKGINLLHSFSLAEKTHIPAGQIFEMNFHFFQSLSDISMDTKEMSLIGYEPGSVIMGNGEIISPRYTPAFFLKQLRLPTRREMEFYNRISLI